MVHVLAKDLREAVLQAAVQGKLSKKEETDSSIESIIESLHFDVKIEKCEEPYDLPAHWKWIQVGNLGETNDTNSFADGPFGSNLKKEHQINRPEVRIIQLSNIGENGWVDDNVKYTSYNHLKTISRCEIKPGDFVIAKMMPAGRTIIVPELRTKIVLGSDAVKFVPNKCLNKNYLLLAMKSNCFLSQVYSEVHGITRVRTSLSKIKSYCIPLPPIEEQARIVAKVDELMAKIDEYEKLEKELTELKEKFPGEMRCAILQAGITGRLVTQSNDEKVSTSILKNSKSSSEYELPDNWACIELNKIVNIVNGFTPLRSNSNFWDSKDVPWFTVDDIREQGHFINHTAQYISNEALSKDTKRVLPKNSVLLCCTASIGEYAYTNIELTTNQQFNGLVVKEECKNDLSPLYLYYYVQTLKRKLIDKSGATTFSFLSTKKLGQFDFPLPPIEEQQRIVEKLNQLLPICDELPGLC